VPHCKYRTPFIFSFDPRFFTSSLQYLLYWFNFCIREILSTLGPLYLFPRASFVDGHLPGGVLFYPFFYVQAPPSSLHSMLISLPCCFGLNHFYQSSLYRLNPNLPHTITLLYHAIAFPLPSRHSEWQLCPSPVHRSSPTRLQHRVSLLACHASQNTLERIWVLRYFDFSLALCATCSARGVSLSPLSLSVLSVSAHNFTKILSM